MILKPFRREHVASANAAVIEDVKVEEREAMMRDTKSSSLKIDRLRRRSTDHFDAHEVFAGGGEMGALMRTVSWSDSAVGPVDTWPQSLRTAVSVCLGSKFPMFVWWGRDLTVFYNDAYAPILGPHKHPRFLGRSAKEQWAEVWSTLGPLTDQVISDATATWFEDFHLYPVVRQGFEEDTYFTFSYSPIRDESGKVGGVFCACQETTKRVLGERRLRNLRELGLQTTNARTVEDACELTADVLSANSADLPFSLVYLGDVGRPSLSLKAMTGVALDRRHVPKQIGLEGDTTSLAVHAARALSERKPMVLDTPLEILGPSSQSAWPESPRRAVILPITASDHVGPAGVLIVGITPRLPFDQDYEGYLDLVVRQLATAVATAKLHEEEKKRAEALAELDRAKTAFFSNVSHEFRTPLTLMLGPIEDGLADVQNPLPAAQRERQTLVLRNGLRLLKLVNTLLDFSRIEAGRAQASYAETDLAAFTKDLASNFESLMSRAGLRLVVDCPPLPEPVWVDREMWEKIVLNLLSNAFKFTFKGEVTVRLRTIDAGVELTVRDTGTGIAASELPRVFERFHRVQGAKGRSFDGSGIGLALVRELVRLHGGQVGVESTVGQGTTFRIALRSGWSHLPDDRLNATANLASPATGAAAYIEEAAGWLTKGRPDLHSTPPPPIVHRQMRFNASPLERNRILLVDDNADMREYVRKLLEGRYLVEAVESGSRALEVARSSPPDLVLSDVMMPGLDGFGLVRELKVDPKTANVPVILLSARAGEEAIVEGIRAGASDYLVKPFNARELAARVEGTIQLARVRNRLSEVLESMGDAFFVVDQQWRMVIVNSSHEQMTRKLRSETLGRVVWDVFPEAAVPGSKCWTELHRCMAERVAVRFVEYYEPLNLWTDVRAHPTAEGIAVFLRDVSEERRAAGIVQRQSEFSQQLLGIVSHDLRNPLFTIQLATANLTEHADLDERAIAVIGRIQSSADRAARLIGDLLDFTQARLGQGIPIQRAPCDLHEVVRRSIDEVRNAFSNRDVIFSSEGDGRGAWDSERLAQVIHNLATNALKYSGPDTPVRVRSTIVGDAALLEVHNAGDPIPEMLQSELFKPLKRGTQEREKASGIGLGLFIVEQIARAHGGSVSVRSTAREGTTFSVRVPGR